MRKNFRYFKLDWRLLYFNSGNRIASRKARQGGQATIKFGRTAENSESNHENDLIDDLHAIFVRGLKVDLINLYV